MRNLAWKRNNKGRVDSSYKVGDFVLVSSKRFPQHHVSKFESQWLGPWKVMEVHHNAVKVKGSPKFGVFEVAFTHCKKWMPEIIEEDFHEDLEIAKEDEDEEENSKFEENVEVMNEEEMKKEDFYFVKKIWKHKYKNGWNFLTEWEGFGVEEATWEPIKAFVLPTGKLNEVFVKYCEQNALESCLKNGLKLAEKIAE